MEKHTCPNCKRVLWDQPFTLLRKSSPRRFFIYKAVDIVLAFDRLYQHFLEWKDVKISATKNCVVFLRNKTFLVAKPMKK